MALTKINNDLNIIQALDDQPNDVGGLTPSQLKAKFDEAGNTLKTYINDTLTAEADTTFATKAELNDVTLGQIPDESLTQIKLVPDIQNSFVPTGTVLYITTAAVPTGFIKCNGAALSRTTYSGLFDVIGTTFGEGDGSTTFNLPDLRGEFIRGLDDGRGIDTARVLGSSQEATSLAQVSYGVTSYVSNGEQVGTGNANYSSSGGDQTDRPRYAFRPRNIALMPCIKF